MSDYTRALNYAFLLLKYRSRSRHEIVTRLKQKEYSPALTATVIAYLEENGYLNDAQFAAVYAQALRNRGYGKRRVELALRRLGIGHEHIVAVSGCDDERARLRDIAQRKIKYYRGKKNAEAKIMRALVSRGFVYSDIIRVLDEEGFSRYED